MRGVSGYRLVPGCQRGMLGLDELDGWDRVEFSQQLNLFDVCMSQLAVWRRRVEAETMLDDTINCVVDLWIVCVLREVAAVPDCVDDLVQLFGRQSVGNHVLFSFCYLVLGIAAI